MREHWSNGGALFAREAFRSWMIALNRRGGVVLLDTLPEEALGRLLRGEARLAVEEHYTSCVLSLMPLGMSSQPLT